MPVGALGVLDTNAEGDRAAGEGVRSKVGDEALEHLLHRFKCAGGLLDLERREDAGWNDGQKHSRQQVEGCSRLPGAISGSSRAMRVIPGYARGSPLFRMDLN